jgi:hypothetical protein
MKPAEIKLALRMADNIGRQLYGGGPGVQGAILAELVSRWLAGHRTELHERVLTQWIELVRSLVPINAAIMFGEHGHPGDRAPPAADPH